jgi:hypothetical protein
MPKDLDDYDDLVEEQLEELERQKEERQRKRQRRRGEILKRWDRTEEEDCSCDTSGTAIFESYPVSFLSQREDFDRATDAEELWVCDECGRIPPEDEVRKRGLPTSR